MPPTFSLEEMYQLIYQDHRDPFHILGPHIVVVGGKNTVAIRCFLPDSRAVSIISTGDNREYVMHRFCDAGFYEAICEDRSQAFPYKVKMVTSRGDCKVFCDPYAFHPTQIGELDRYLLREGFHYKSYEKLGAHLLKVGDICGVYFAVWAPNARAISVIGSFNEWDRRFHMMRLLENLGIWEIFIPSIGEGNNYKYQVMSKQGKLFDKADPYGFYSELSPQTASVVYNIERYQWQDRNWVENRQKWQSRTSPISVYEAHAGSWMRKSDNSFLGYRELAQELVAYVKHMGYTHIELLPIQEHPFYGSWGYQTIGYYAPSSRYGMPDDFKYFVDQCHQNDIGVILDWAPAHFPHDAHGLTFFDGTYLYEHEDPRQREHRDWNTYIYNYGRYEVKNFLIANALFWFEKYHIDGLRVDAVASMLYLDYSKRQGEWVPNKYGGHENLQAVAFIQELNNCVHNYYPGSLMIAEESTSWQGVTRQTYLGGLGFDFKWNMGWMNDMLRYMMQDPIYRKYQHHTFSFSLWYAFSENFLLSLSHDEVVHGKYSLIEKMPGDMWKKFANLRLLYGYMFAHPGKKMLFMGCDFGQWREWSHDGGLDWEVLVYDQHRSLQKYVRDLNFFYRSHSALHRETDSFSWVDYSDADNSVIAFCRVNQEEHLLFIFNFTPLPRYQYRLGIQKFGTYREIFNSDSVFYWGSNVGNAGQVVANEVSWHDKPYHLCLNLPPLGMLVFKLVEQGQGEKYADNAMIQAKGESSKTNGQA